MGAKTFKPPPSPNTGDRGGDWVELVSGLLLGESSHVLRELDLEGIESRTAVEASGVKIKVRPTRLEDARFVFARVSFSREATLSAPRAETGVRPWKRISKVAGLVAGVLLVASMLAFVPGEDRGGLRCPGGQDSLMAPRGGCVGVSTSVHD